MGALNLIIEDVNFYKVSVDSTQVEQPLVRWIGKWFFFFKFKDTVFLWNWCEREWNERRKVTTIHIELDDETKLVDDMKPISSGTAKLSTRQIQASQQN